MQCVPSTSSIVNISIANTVTFQEAFQFGLSTDTWNFTGQHFKCEVKSDRASDVPLATFGTADGTIVINDAIQRILQFNVSEAALRAVLPVGQYVYDLVMYDDSAPSIRSQLMQGLLFVSKGVTED